MTLGYFPSMRAFEYAMRSVLILLLLPLMLSFWPAPARAAQAFDNCTGVVASIPAVISTPGYWCVKQDLATSSASGNAITIAANGVTLDCNDFLIDGTAAGINTQAVAIYAESTLDSTIRNCRVRGFFSGIVLDNASGSGGGHLVEDNHLDLNTSLGMQVDGDGSVVRHNEVLATGSASRNTGASSIGIQTVGAVDVLDNTISGVLATTGQNGNATGIYTNLNTAGSTASVSHNRVRGVHSDGTGKSWGIDNVASGAREILRYNDVSGLAEVGSTGIACGTTSYRVSHSAIVGFKTFLSPMCGDAGYNDEQH